jgi:DNA-binding MarR family transcriptional regulator
MQQETSDLEMERPAKTLKRNGNAQEPAPARQLDLGELEQTPGFMIRILQLQIFEAFYQHFEQLGLSPVEFSILVTVRDNKTVTQSELAQVLRMQLPNLVKILSRMEAAGIVRRKRSARDKRAVELALSATGLKRANEASRLGTAFTAQNLAVLNRQERSAFLEMLSRLVEAHRRSAT